MARKVLLLALLSGLVACAAAISISVSSTISHAIPSTLYGYMWEDINHSGDGGLYAEMLQNRAFQLVSTGTSGLTAWSALNGVSLSVTNSVAGVSSALPNSLQVSVASGTSGSVGFANSGYWGIKVQAGWNYTGSFYVKSSNYAGPVTVSLVGASSNTVYATATPVTKVTSSYTKYTFTFQPTTSAPDANNYFEVHLTATGSAATVYFGLFSLFPPTFNNHPNGLRVDLATAMAATAPKVWRFPGGNNLEGNTIDTRWKWNETIGPLENRPGRLGDWGYMNTDGLGLMEYMQWAEDLNATVILGVWDGLSLASSNAVVAQSALQPYVTDVINELHFLTDPSTTTWGALRAQYGRTEPYPLTYVEIGNEEFTSTGSASYASYRWNAFTTQIKAAFPNLVFLDTDYASVALTGPTVQYIDYHNYDYPQGLTSKATMFDSYSRSGPKYFVGEFAVISTSSDVWGSTGRLNYPIMQGSAAEGAFMTGMERNSDVVFASAYAPTLQHINGTQWTPDLITFDAMTLVKSTSYYVQQMFGTHMGTHVLSSTPAQGTGNGGLYWVASVNQNTNTYYLKVANTATSSIAATISLGFTVSSAAQTISLSGSASTSNTLSMPNNILPVTGNVTVSNGNSLSYTFPANGVVVFTMQKPGTGTPTTTLPSTSPTPTVSPTTTPSTTLSSTTPTPSPSGCSAMYGQCGGENWAGATCCSAGTCTYSNDWYSQCVAS